MKITQILFGFIAGNTIVWFCIGLWNHFNGDLYKILLLGLMFSIGLVAKLISDETE